MGPTCQIVDTSWPLHTCTCTIQKVICFIHGMEGCQEEFDRSIMRSWWFNYYRQHTRLWKNLYSLPRNFHRLCRMTKKFHYKVDILWYDADGYNIFLSLFQLCLNQIQGSMHLWLGSYLKLSCNIVWMEDSDIL